MPMHELGRVRVVVNVDHDALPLLETQERSGKLTIVQRCRNDVLGEQFPQGLSRCGVHSRPCHRPPTQNVAQPTLSRPRQLILLANDD